MRERETDVVVVGAGGDGPALAWRLGQRGVDVTILEAGPFYGNEEWPAVWRRRGCGSTAACPTTAGSAAA